MRKLVLAAVFLLWAVAARAAPLLPTAEGTSWEYESTETRTGEAPVHSVITVRAGKQLFDGKELVKFETLTGNVISKTELMSVDANGIACLARSGKDGKITKLNPPEPIIAAPLKVGAVWELESEVSGIKMHQRFTVVAEERVTVPAGSFQAFHLRCEDSSLMSIKLDRWFAPGTGLVKETTVLKGPGGLMQRATLELSKFTEVLPKPATTPAAAAPSTVEHQPASSPAPIVPAASPETPAEPATVPGDPPSAPAKKLTVEVSSEPTGGLKTEFKSTVANIYVRWRGHDLPADASVRVTWVAEDVGDLVEPNFVIDETESVAPSPNASARFTLGRPPDGWAEGKYRLEFYVNDLLVETIRVTIVR